MAQDPAKHFEGLNQPLDRLLRLVFDRDIYSCTPTVMDYFKELLGAPAQSEEDDDAAEFIPAAEPVFDADSVESESLIDLHFP